MAIHEEYAVVKSSLEIRHLVEWIVTGQRVANQPGRNVQLEAREFQSKYFLISLCSQKTEAQS